MGVSKTDSETKTEMISQNAPTATRRSGGKGAKCISEQAATAGPMESSTKQAATAGPMESSTDKTQEVSDTRQMPFYQATPPPNSPS